MVANPAQVCSIMNAMQHVAIVIVDYNGERETRACLQSLKTIIAKEFTYSITIVDNASKEPLSIPEKELPKHTTIIRSDSNLGFTDGNNLAIKQALEQYNPDYILLLNNDTTVDPHFLHYMVACAQEMDHVGIVTPKIYFSPGREYHKESYPKTDIGNVLWYAGGSIDWQNLDAFHRGVDEVDRGQFDTQKTSDFATGCCALIPRKIIDEVGVFDPKYFLYLEDADLSMRITQHGYHIHFCPVAKIWHVNAGSSGGAGSALHQYYQTRNRLYFFFLYGQFRTRLTVLKYALKLLLRGTRLEQRATLDWLIGNMGKQAII